MPRPDRSASVCAAVDALLAVEAPSGGAEAPGYVAALLDTLDKHLSTTGSALVIDRDDGAGAEVEVAHGQPLREATATRIRIPVGMPWSAWLDIKTGPEAIDGAVAAVLARLFGFALDMQRHAEAGRSRQQTLSYLVEVSDLLTQSLDLNLTIALIPRLVVPRLGHWAALFLLDDAGVQRIASVAHVDETVETGMLDPIGDIGHRFASAVFRAALDAPPGSPLPEPLGGFGVPLIARGQRIGALAIGREQRPTHDDLVIAEEIARRASAAIANARLHEERRQVAHTLQQSLLPAALPWIPRIDVGACYLPSGYETEVGGDLYDVVAMPSGEWLAYVGDVSGKGIQAAAMTGFVRDVVRILIADGKPVPGILDMLNTALFERGERYITLALATFRPAPPLGRDAEATIYLAGHDTQFVLHASGDISTVGTPGTAIGLLARSVHNPATVNLQPGDTIVFYTDGVTERRRGAEFLGRERVRQTLRTLPGHPASVIAQRIANMAKNFSAEPARDDIAVLAIRNAVTQALE